MFGYLDEDKVVALYADESLHEKVREHVRKRNGFAQQRNIEKLKTENKSTGNSGTIKLIVMFAASMIGTYFVM